MPDLTVEPIARADTLAPLLPAIWDLPTNLGDHFMSASEVLTNRNRMPLSSTKSDPHQGLPASIDAANLLHAIDWFPLGRPAWNQDFTR